MLLKIHFKIHALRINWQTKNNIIILIFYFSGNKNCFCLCAFQLVHRNSMISIILFYEKIYLCWISEKTKFKMLTVITFIVLLHHLISHWKLKSYLNFEWALRWPYICKYICVASMAYQNVHNAIIIFYFFFF